MIKNIIKYGLISGVIVAALMFLNFQTTDFDFNNPYGELIGYSTMVAAFSMIFVGVKKFRDSREDGKAKFWQSLLIGLGISLIATIFYAVAWGFIDGFTGGTFIEQYATATLTDLKESGASAQEIAATEKEMEYYKEMYQNPITKLAITASEIFPVGILVSLISALVFWIKDRKS